MVGSDLIVFSLKEGRFSQLLNVPSRLHEWVEKEIEYEQVLDVQRTVSTSGKQFCFTKTVFIDGRRLKPPRITQPCYSRFTSPSARGGLLPQMK